VPVSPILSIPHFRIHTILSGVFFLVLRLSIPHFRILVSVSVILL